MNKFAVSVVLIVQIGDDIPTHITRVVENCTDGTVQDLLAGVNNVAFGRVKDMVDEYAKTNYGRAGKPSVKILHYAYSVNTVPD